jgi:SOS-response transcriptional repressor LexA
MNIQTDKKAQREALKLRIEKALARGPSQTEVATFCGVTNQAVSGWKTTGKIGNRSLRLLAAATGTNPAWLLTGVGPDSIDSEDGSAPTHSLTPVRQGRTGVPLLTWDQAISASRMAGEVQEGVVEYIRADGPVGERAYAVIVNDDTNEPAIPARSRAVIDPDVAHRPNDYVFVLFADGSATIKQLVQDGGATYLRPHNTRYPIRPLPADALILGVVIEVTQRFR